MKTVIGCVVLAAMLPLAGCQNGAGKQIAKGAVRGAGYGAVEKNTSGPIAENAAKGALSSTYQVRDQNVNARKADKRAAEAAEDADQ